VAEAGLVDQSFAINVCICETLYFSRWRCSRAIRLIDLYAPAHPPHRGFRPYVSSQRIYSCCNRRRSVKVSLNQPVRIAIVGAGVICASWAAHHLARGLDVVATDPGSQAEANLRKYVDDAWPLMTLVGLSTGASRDRLIQQRVAEAAFVSEHMNGGNLLRRSAK
jgi:hypothetical protein